MPLNHRCPPFFDGCMPLCPPGEVALHSLTQISNDHLHDYQHMSRHHERTALILWTQGEELKQGSDTPDISMVILKSWAVTTAIFHRASSRPLPPPCAVRCGSANGQVGFADFDRPEQPVGPVGLGLAMDGLACACWLVWRSAAVRVHTHTPVGCEKSVGLRPLSYPSKDARWAP